MELKNLERAAQIDVELKKLKLAQNALSNGGVVRVFTSLQRTAGEVYLNVEGFNEEVAKCIAQHIEKLEQEIETL